MITKSLKRSPVVNFHYKKDFQTSPGYLYPQDLTLCHNLHRGRFLLTDLHLDLTVVIEVKMEVTMIIEVRKILAEVMDFRKVLEVTEVIMMEVTVVTEVTTTEAIEVTMMEVIEAIVVWAARGHPLEEVNAEAVEAAHDLHLGEVNVEASDLHGGEHNKMQTKYKSFYAFVVASERNEVSEFC